jgi:hypothetical protein
MKRGKNNTQFIKKAHAYIYQSPWFYSWSPREPNLVEYESKLIQTKKLLFLKELDMESVNHVSYENVSKRTHYQGALIEKRRLVT